MKHCSLLPILSAPLASQAQTPSDDQLSEQPLVAPNDEIMSTPMIRRYKRTVVNVNKHSIALIRLPVKVATQPSWSGQLMLPGQTRYSSEDPNDS